MLKKQRKKSWVKKEKNHYIFVLVFFLTLSIGRYWKLLLSGVQKTYAMPNVDTDGALYLIWYRIEQFAQNTPESINTFLAYPHGLDIIRTPYQSLLDLIFLYPFFPTGINIILLNNITAILAYTIAGVITYSAFYYLTKTKIAAFAGSILFTFSSYAIVAGRTQIALLHTWVIPLTFLLSLRAWKTKNPWNYALAGLSIAMAFHVNAYYGFFCGIIFTGISIGKIFFEKKKIDFVKKTGIALLATGIGFFTINFGFFYNNLYTFDKAELQSTGKIIQKPDVIETQNMLIPGNDNLLYGIFQTNVNINSLFIGYFPLVLLILSIILIPRILKKHREWTPIITGSWITFTGVLILISFSSINEIYLKYLFMFRATSRMLRITDFIIALLITITIAVLLKKYKNINKKKLYIFVGLALLWIMAERISLHYTVWDTTDIRDFPPALEEIKNNDSSAVLILPDRKRYKSVTYEYTLFQTIFEKPIINGPRTTEESKNTLNKILEIDEESLALLNTYGANTILLLEDLCTEATCKTSNIEQLVENGKLLYKGEYNGIDNQTVNRIELFKKAKIYEIPQDQNTGSFIQNSLIEVYQNTEHTDTKKESSNDTNLVEAKKLNRYQAKFTLQTGENQTIIGFNEPYHENWELYKASWLNKLCTNEGVLQKVSCLLEKTTLANLFLEKTTAKHETLNKYMNGWTLDNSREDSSYIIKFQRSNIVLLTKILQSISIIGTIYIIRKTYTKKRETKK